MLKDAELPLPSFEKGFLIVIGGRLSTGMLTGEELEFKREHSQGDSPKPKSPPYPAYILVLSTGEGWAPRFVAGLLEQPSGKLGLGSRRPGETDLRRQLKQFARFAIAHSEAVAQ